jgi:hypothetical protein
MGLCFYLKMSPTQAKSGLAWATTPLELPRIEVS